MTNEISDGHGVHIMSDERFDAYDPLHPERLTWAVLLGRWVEFAGAAVGLPDDAAGRLWRESVADVIGLQAVWFALQHLDELEEGERALGLDRAGVLVGRHVAALRVRWGGEGGDALPAMVAELIDEAEAALAEARDTGGDDSSQPDRASGG